MEAGADDYVVKPVIFAVLLARIHALFRRQHTERSALVAFADLTLDAGSHSTIRG